MKTTIAVVLIWSVLCGSPAQAHALQATEVGISLRSIMPEFRVAADPVMLLASWLLSLSSRGNTKDSTINLITYHLLTPLLSPPILIAAQGIGKPCAEGKTLTSAVSTEVEADHQLKTWASGSSVKADFAPGKDLATGVGSSNGAVTGSAMAPTIVASISSQRGVTLTVPDRDWDGGGYVKANVTISPIYPLTGDTVTAVITPLVESGWHMDQLILDDNPVRPRTQILLADKATYGAHAEHWVVVLASDGKGHQAKYGARISYFVAKIAGIGSNQQVNSDKY